MARSTDTNSEDDIESRTHRKEGVTIAPWIVTLILSLGVQLVGAAYVTGTAITRIEALGTRIDRLEKQIDELMSIGRTHSPVGYSSPISSEHP